MTATQFPIDGKFKVTSPFGWRTHPTQKVKKHHNGADLWKAKTVNIEAFHDGKVQWAGPSTTKKQNGEPGGFGYYVKILHKIDGKFYVSVYAHMQKGSLKVKKGQKVTAGTVLGQMGASGDVTGPHLHWEICQGKKYTWSATGKGLVDPIAFTKAIIAKEKIVATIPEDTPKD